jgi:taurine dioxygenase
VPDILLDGAPAFERICRVFGDSLQPVNANGNFVQLYIVQNRNSVDELKRPSDDWHSDLSYLDRPASATVLYAIEVPEDVDGLSQGDTLFVDMAAAYAALPVDMQQRLCRMRGLHRHPSVPDSQNPHLRPGQPDVTSHPMVVDTQVYRDAQASVARALFINPAYTVGVSNEDGSAVADGKQLLHELVTHCLQPQFMLRLRWKVGSLVVWDNSALWHRATTLEMASSAHEQRRVMFRASVLCDSPL